MLRHRGGYRCHQRRVGAHPIVVTVGADQRPIQTNIHRFDRRNDFQFGCYQILLGDAVFLMQDVQYIEFYLLRFLVLIKGSAADKQIQFFPADAICQRAFVLFRTQMRKQVGNHELRISLFFPDVHTHRGTIRPYHHTVESKGNGGPLIFPNPTVIMGFQIGKFFRLVQGMGFQVQTGGIDMRHPNAGALFQRQATDHCRDQCLVAVDLIHPIPCLVGVIAVKGDKPARF